MKKTKQRLVLNLALLLAALILSIGISEGVLRALGISPKVILLTSTNFESAYMRSLNPLLGYELKPNYRSNSPTNHFGSFSYVNSDGQRDIEREISRTGGRRRVILLGDSVVAGHGQPDLNLTISRTMEKILADGTEVLNFGVGGYTTIGEVELLRTKGLKYKPDAVLLIHVDNDFRNRNGDMRPYPVNRPKWVEALFLHSDLFRLTSIQLDLYGFGRDFHGSWLDQHKHAIRDSSVEEAIETLKELAVENNFQLGVAIWPRFGDEYISNWRHEKVGSTQELKIMAILSKLKIPMIDLQKILEGDWKSRCKKTSCPNPRLLYSAGGDRIHPNTLAAEVTAHALIPFLGDLMSKSYE